jgi:[ribosomal protein S18]-alanine N-acetyltransferase
MTPAEMATIHAAAFSTPRPWTEAELAEMLTNPLVFALDRPGGFLVGRVVAGEAELLTIAVDPALRRQGTGAALMAAFLDHARRAGADRAFLEVADDNTAARALYQRSGFVVIGRRKAYYHGPAGRIDAILMAQSL